MMLFLYVFYHQFSYFSRVLGGLLAAHLLAVDPSQPFGSLMPDHYDNDLLELAHDLANRLLPAFDKTKTLLPWPRVSFKCFL